MHFTMLSDIAGVLDNLGQWLMILHYILKFTKLEIDVINQRVSTSSTQKKILKFKIMCPYS